MEIRPERHRPRTLLLLVASALALAPACAAGPPAPEPEEADVVFVDVNVLPMDREGVLAGQTVAVRDGRIVAMGAADEVAIAGQPQEIDGSGRYLMPGLGEMHGHLPNPDTGADLTETFLFLYLANGLTTVRGMQGHPSQIELRERIEAGDLLGPRLFLGSPAMSGNAVTEPGQARERVRRYSERGFDLLKIHEGLSPPVFQAIAETAREVGIPFGGHVPDAVGLVAALEAGQITVDHLDGFVEALVPAEALEGVPALVGVAELVGRIDESGIRRLVDALNREGGWVVPTMVLWETGILTTRPAEEILAERPEVRYLPRGPFADRWVRAVDSRFEEADVEAARRVARVRRDILRAIHENGSRILLGTDSPQIFSVPGFSIHHEMEMWVEDIGMTPWEVLETGTRKVAEYLGATDFGTVAPGQRADLVLLESNPVDDIGNFADRAGVMIAGRWLAEDEIQRRLERIAARYVAEG